MGLLNYSKSEKVTAELSAIDRELNHGQKVLRQQRRKKRPADSRSAGLGTAEKGSRYVTTLFIT